MYQEGSHQSFCAIVSRASQTRNRKKRIDSHNFIWVRFLLVASHDGETNLHRFTVDMALPLPPRAAHLVISGGNYFDSRLFFFCSQNLFVCVCVCVRYNPATNLFSFWGGLTNTGTNGNVFPSAPLGCVRNLFPLFASVFSRLCFSPPLHTLATDGDLAWWWIHRTTCGVLVLAASLTLTCCCNLTHLCRI